MEGLWTQTKIYITALYSPSPTNFIFTKTFRKPSGFLHRLPNGFGYVPKALCNFQETDGDEVFCTLTSGLNIRILLSFKNNNNNKKISHLNSYNYLNGRPVFDVTNAIVVVETVWPWRIFFRWLERDTHSLMPFSWFLLPVAVDPHLQQQSPWTSYLSWSSPIQTD